MKNWPTACSSFDVHYDYPVVFTRNVFAPSNPVLINAIKRGGGASIKRCMVFVDSNVALRQAEVMDSIPGYFRRWREMVELVHPPVVVPGGEAAKNDWHLIEKILALLLNHKMCRHSYVLAVGGGSVLDAVGFATALFHRGLRLIRLPTTVLAQNDAGVGVKNAIDFLGGKNILGAFAPPYAVIDDFAFLDGLSDAAWCDGIAEAFKVAMIKDAAFFDFLCANASNLRRRDFTAMEETIVRCATLHLNHIQSGGDPFEFGSGRPLDFGHWLAHKLEVMSEYRISHGRAVAIGIMTDTFYAVHQGWLDAASSRRLYEGLTASGLGLWSDLLDRRLPDGSLEILQGLRDFQEHIGGDLCLTFPCGLGKRHEVHEIDEPAMEKALCCLRDESKRLMPSPLC